jgi:hypothetical protein
MAAPGEGDRRQSSSRYCPISLLRGCRLDPLLLQRLPHALRDHGRIVVDGECHGTLEPMRPGDEDRLLPGRGRRSLMAASVIAAGDASITLRTSMCVFHRPNFSAPWRSWPRSSATSKTTAGSMGSPADRLVALVVPGEQASGAPAYRPCRASLVKHQLAVRALLCVFHCSSS